MQVRNVLRMGDAHPAIDAAVAVGQRTTAMAGRWSTSACEVPLPCETLGGVIGRTCPFTTQVLPRHAVARIVSWHPMQGRSGPKNDHDLYH